MNAYTQQTDAQNGLLYGEKCFFMPFSIHNLVLINIANYRGKRIKESFFINWYKSGRSRKTIKSIRLTKITTVSSEHKNGEYSNSTEFLSIRDESNIARKNSNFMEKLRILWALFTSFVSLNLILVSLSLSLSLIMHARTHWTCTASFSPHNSHYSRIRI